MSSSAQASPSKPQAIPVTVDNFIRAESDLYLGNIAKDGGFEFAKTCRQRGPGEQRNIVLLVTSTVQEAENVLEQVWPQDPWQKLETAAVDLLKNTLEYEIVQREELDRLAVATMELGIRAAQREIEALRASR